MELIAKNGVWLALGALLGVMGWHPWDSWQWWAWFLAFIGLVDARDWAMRSNAALTGAEGVRVEDTVMQQTGGLNDGQHLGNTGL